MLVLSRKVNQTIIVGDSVVITVIEVRGNGNVRLGIDAPSSILVDRGEVRERRDRDKKKGGDPC